MLKTEIIEVNPFDLETITVGDARVVELMTQIEAAGGILEPVAVWMDANGKIHVVNGFHRAECARRLGYTSIKAMLVDCDEARFWDLRISATTEHKAVTNDRLHLWMLDAWMLTEWSKLDKGSFAETAYIVYSYMYGRLNQPSLLTRQEKEIVAWFDERSKVWSKDTLGIARIILDKSGLFLHHNNLLNIAAKKHLTYEEYVAAVRALEKDVEARTAGVNDKAISVFIEKNLASDNEEWIAPTAIKEQESAKIEQRKIETQAHQVADQIVRLKGALMVVDSILASGVKVEMARAVQSGIDTQIVKAIDCMNKFVEWVSGDYKWDIAKVREENARLKQENADLRQKVNRGPVIVPEGTLAQSGGQLKW